MSLKCRGMAVTFRDEELVKNALQNKLLLLFPFLAALPVRTDWPERLCTGGSAIHGSALCSNLIITSGLKAVCPEDEKLIKEFSQNAQVSLSLKNEISGTVLGVVPRWVNSRCISRVNCQLISGKCTSKHRWNVNTHQWKWHKWKEPEATSAGEKAMKAEPSLALGGNSLVCCLWKIVWWCKKPTAELPSGPVIPLNIYLPNTKTSIQKDGRALLFISAGSTDSQDMKIIQKSINIWIIKCCGTYP